jgi:hypothetical protein
METSVFLIVIEKAPLRRFLQFSQARRALLPAVPKDET